MEELKPCPFDGTTPKLVQQDNTFFVMCLQCTCEQYPDPNISWTEEEAISAWNRRVGESNR